MLFANYLSEIAKLASPKRGVWVVGGGWKLVRIYVHARYQVYMRIIRIIRKDGKKGKNSAWCLVPGASDVMPPGGAWPGTWCKLSFFLFFLLIFFCGVHVSGTYVFSLLLVLVICPFLVICLCCRSFHTSSQRTSAPRDFDHVHDDVFVPGSGRPAAAAVFL